MDYGSLIQRSWRLTWQHKVLWVLGLFVPGFGSCGSGSGGGGGGSGGGTGGGSRSPSTDDIDRTGDMIGRWIEQNLALIVAIVGAIILLALILWVISFIARGAMAWATASVARGEPVALGAAWGAGLRLFWRNVGLALLSAGIVLLLLVPVGVLVALAVALGSTTSGGSRVAVILFSVLLGLAMLIALVPLLIGLSIAVVLAQRAMAVDDQGPLVGLRTGWRIVRQRTGVIALTWLITVGLAIAIGIGFLVILLAVLVPVGLAGFAVYSAGGLSAGLLIFGGVAFVLLILVLWGLSAVANTYAWHYWTLAYLRLTDRLTERLEPLPVG